MCTNAPGQAGRNLVGMKTLGGQLHDFAVHDLVQRLVFSRPHLRNRCQHFRYTHGNYLAEISSQPLCRSAFLRSASLSNAFRNRIDLGVISTNSSSSMYSSAASSSNRRGGFSTVLISAVEERMFVNFFSRAAFTGRSLSRQCSATISPS